MCFICVGVLYVHCVYIYLSLSVQLLWWVLFYFAQVERFHIKCAYYLTVNNLTPRG